MSLSCKIAAACRSVILYQTVDCKHDCKVLVPLYDIPLTDVKTVQDAYKAIDVKFLVANKHS